MTTATDETLDEQALQDYKDGTPIPYLGSTLCLRLVEVDDTDTTEVERDDATIIVRLASGLSETRRQHLIYSALYEWLEQQAAQILQDKAQYFAKTLGVDVRSIKIGMYKSRWGSCSEHGDISFDWRIVLAPESVVDYLVIHELCHIIEQNHSAQYWSLVGHLMPDYKTAQQWLRTSESSLNL